MKRITKIRQPRSLVEHMAKTHASYENLPGEAKDALRNNLIEEQGYLCCYCMKRLSEPSEKHMKVEHFMDQDHYPAQQLVYSNLFGACLGNEGKPGRLQTCDTKKGNKTLTINPTSLAPDCESLFKYNAEGEISSKDNNEEINKAINNVLNLNEDNLKDCRREVFLAVQEKYEIEGKRLGSGPLKLNYLEKEMAWWLSKSDGQYRPFCMVAKYVLDKKRKQIASQRAGK
jgi:uncharacterized protein (TIGR02646 family)